jgi:serine protease Do
VIEDSPADRAGVRAGDLLLELDGVPVEDATDLQRLMLGERIGQPARATLLRDGHERRITLVPVELQAG